MNSSDLAQKIKLHPRCAVLRGKIETRMKNKGELPGHTPHYAESGCPRVAWQGANALPQSSAAEIEFTFVETGFPLPSAMTAFSVRQGNLTQLIYGSNGQAPSQDQYRVLREAGEVVKRLADTRREVFMVSLPIFTPGQFGVAVGRHYLVGLFGTDGQPIYLNPGAVGHVLEAEYPLEQKERSVATDTAQHVPAPESDWYAAAQKTLASAGLKGNELSNAILRFRGNQLVESKVAPNLKAGVAMARIEAADRLKQLPKGKGIEGRALIAALANPAAPQRSDRSR